MLFVQRPLIFASALACVGFWSSLRSDGQELSVAKPNKSAAAWESEKEKLATGGQGLKDEFLKLRPDLLPIQKQLPDPFTRADGTRVSDVSQWSEQRAYLKRMLETLQYGRMPPKPNSYRIAKEFQRPIFDGLGVEERYVLTLERNGKTCRVRFGVVRPDKIARRPAVIKNCYVFFDDEVFTDRGGDRIRPFKKISETAERDRFAAEQALKRGYVLCKFLREDVASDYLGQRDKKIYALYPEYDWGCIAAWAWAYQVMIDVLVDGLEYADAQRIAATGHSRGGKATLWAAVCDARIAVTIPSASGAGGTSSYRFAEEGQEPQSVRHMKNRHPFWWTERLFKFSDNEFRLPYDGHTVRALVAPRAQLNTYGRHDYMTNPYGAQVTHEAAQLVYEWLGVGDKIAMHWRAGGHAQSEDDWLALLDFTDQIFFGKASAREYNTNPFPNYRLPVNWRPPRESFGASKGAAAISETAKTFN